MEFTNTMHDLDQPKGFRQLFRHKTKIKPLLVRVVLHTAKTLRESRSIAVLTAGANLLAATNRIPCRVGPLDFGFAEHSLREYHRASAQRKALRLLSQSQCIRLLFAMSSFSVYIPH